MYKEYADKLVAALRSGEYPQTTGRLEVIEGSVQHDSVNPKPVGFCCLGVACNILVKEGIISRSIAVPNGTVRYGVNPDDEEQDYLNWNSGFLPHLAMKTLGFRTENGHINSLDSSLVQMNDSGYSFAEIADIIEQHWEEI